MVIQNFYLRLAKLSRDSIQRFQRFFNREETPTGKLLRQIFVDSSIFSTAFHVHFVL